MARLGSSPRPLSPVTRRALAQANPAKGVGGAAEEADKRRRQLVLVDAVAGYCGSMVARSST